LIVQSKTQSQAHRARPVRHVSLQNSTTTSLPVTASPASSV
jgi:hypothetical protein